MAFGKFQIETYLSAQWYLIFQGIHVTEINTMSSSYCSFGIEY